VRRIIAAALTSVALATATTAVPAAIDPPVAAAKTCSSRYVHAVVGGEEKCLGTGQFCSRTYQSTYRRYGFACKTGSDGRDRLFKA